MERQVLRKNSDMLCFQRPLRSRSNGTAFEIAEAIFPPGMRKEQSAPQISAADRSRNGGAQDGWEQDCEVDMASTRF